MGPTRTGRHGGGANRPQMSSSRGPLRCGVFWCPLEPSVVVFIVVKFDSI
jgi:hypothetical protein